MKNVAVVEIAKSDKLKSPKTNKKYTVQAEKIVRKLDNVLTDLNKVSQDARDLAEQTEIPTTDVSEKDYDRILEMTVILESTANVLFHLTSRMARKYVGKEVEPLDLKKRDSLKLK